MTKGRKLGEKHYQYLKHLLDTRDSKALYDFLVNSEVYISKDYYSSFNDAYKVEYLVNPEIYKKYDSQLTTITKLITRKLGDFSKVHFTRSDARPDLSKFQILQNSFTPILTPWEEINNDQNLLINQLRAAKDNIDFQNIGNTSRTILQKISKIVFDKKKHLAPENIDIGESKFKNRLHTYIRTELGGNKNKELRDYAISSINTAEKSVDLSNKLTHDLNANNLMAELCVIGTFAVVSVIKLIHNNN